MKLDELPREDGFRLRGQSVTRLETFVDAAFAFALTLLVIAGDDLPSSFAELREALQRTPVFVGCFVLIAMFWAAHNRWSRRFGLEDARATVLSMAFVLVVMIYVYPLRIVTASGLHLLTGGWVPADMRFSAQDAMLDLQTAFIVYGLGFSALAGLLWLLNRHALARAEILQLDALEQHGTRVEMTIQGILAGTGLISVLIACWLLVYPTPQAAPVTPGLPMFVYMLLGVAIPLYVVRANRELQRLRAGGSAS